MSTADTTTEAFTDKRPDDVTPYLSR